jgi:LPS sulfotransferase NodH
MTMAERLLTPAEATAANAAASHDTPGNAVLHAYAIVAQARTGSTMLEERLRARGLGMPFEYLNPNLERALVARWTGSEKPVRFERYMDLLKRHRTSANGYFGIKCLHSQLDRRFARAGGMRAFLLTFDRIVVLNRRDKLAQAISAVRAEQTGQWTSHLAEAGKEPAFDARTISQRIHRFLLQDRALAAMKLDADRPVLALEYEAFRDAPEESWARVQTFLGVEPAPAGAARPKTERQRDALSEEWERRYLRHLGVETD